MKQKQKVIRMLWNVIALICLISVFPLSWRYMKHQGWVSSGRKESEYQITAAEGTGCTIKSNALDGVPVFADAGSTVQKGLFPEGKCCEVKGTAENSGEKWVQVSYCGIDGWMKKKHIRFLSDKHWYIGKNSVVYMNSLTEKGICGYREPKMTAEIVAEGITYGMEFRVKSINQGWGLVTDGEKEFWLNMFHMGSYPVKGWKVQTLSRAAEINLRKKPGEEEKMLCKIPEKTKLDIQEFKNGWGKTEYEGQTGWVMLHYLIPMADKA